MKLRLFFPVIVSLVCAAPSAAQAFCGFYVGGADSKLYNNATQVVLMRDGTRTVLSMRNNYQGPPEGFAMVIPVPEVLQKDNVKTLPDEIFTRIDELSAPRLVEYWEQDPCNPPRPMMLGGTTSSADFGSARTGITEGTGVTIEAQFDVGEYNIVILSANDSTGLETWLKQEKYQIPEGAAPYLRPYVESGSKFFVAKVDPTKVKFKDGQAMLSPLRFHYDTPDFQLPVRLGLMNSSGTQDLLVHILAPGQRYDVANYPNVTIPTNINVNDSVRHSFGEFYAALFDSTIEKTPGAVVTEYSWDASSCDPCPTPALTHSELATLGMDVLHTQAKGTKARRIQPRSFVLTRLHARYSADTLGADLIFRAAKGVQGGSEFGRNLSQVANFGGLHNAFQGRYAIRHEWQGKIECEKPVRGTWGGPPVGTKSTSPQSATDLAFVTRGKTVLANAVAEDVPLIGLVAQKTDTGKNNTKLVSANTESSKPETGKNPEEKKSPTDEKTPAKKNGSKGCSTSGGSEGGWMLMLCALYLIGQRRKRLADHV